jgi:hypothetical protein
MRITTRESATNTDRQQTPSSSSYPKEVTLWVLFGVSLITGIVVCAHLYWKRVRLASLQESEDVADSSQARSSPVNVVRGPPPLYGTAVDI